MTERSERSLAIQAAVRADGCCGALFDDYDGERVCVLPHPCKMHGGDLGDDESPGPEALRRDPGGSQGVSGGAGPHMTGPTLIKHLVGLYYASDRSSGQYRGPTVESELERIVSDPDERRWYRAQVIDKVRADPVHDCVICGEPFTGKRGLRNHMRSAHPADANPEARRKRAVARYLAGDPVADIANDEALSTLTIYADLRAEGVQLGRSA